MSSKNSLLSSFNKCYRKKDKDICVISASYIGIILGLNKYRSIRDNFKKETGEINYSSKPNEAISHGIKYEDPAVKEYCKRHNLDYSKGFAPPYLFSKCSKYNVLVGGKGDYVYTSNNGKNILLEIKCLYSRDITEKIPFHYWIQIQTMLYIYYLLKIDIDYSIYCENIFNKEGNLEKYWECRVNLDLDYFEEKIIPVLDNYSKIKIEDISAGPIKRKRDNSFKEIPSKDFFRKYKKSGTSLVQRVDQKKIYSHYVNSDIIFGPSCLNNFIRNDLLKDWYNYRVISKGDKNKTSLSKGDFNNNSLDTSLILSHLNKILKPDKDFIVLDIDKEIYSSSSEIFNSSLKENFSIVKYNETLKSIKDGDDIIFGGQLYNPTKNLWSNYDILIKNSCLANKIDESTNKEISRPFPKHYTPVKIINYPYNIDNLTTKKARLDLVMQLDTLNFYHSNDNKSCFVFDSRNKITEIDLEKSFYLFHKFEEGIEWLKDLTDEKSKLKVSPPNDTRLLPNVKVSSKDVEYEKYKSNLVEKNKELTSLWSISRQIRDKLIFSKYRILTIHDLEKNIEKEEVKEILGNIQPKLKNMFLANRIEKIINLKSVRRELKELKNSCEVFLDFEFTSEFIYVAGLYECYQGKTSFKQFHLKTNNEDSQADLLNDFADYIKKIYTKYRKNINCYHWGQVEERLVKQYLPDIFNIFDFIDVHELILDHNLAIPNCKSYSIKDVARSLKSLKHIETEWKENTDGYWCNQSINNLLSKNNLSEEPLNSFEGFNKILEYNYTDCKVLYDIVNFFRR